MYIEYDWKRDIYRFRIGASMFTDFRGVRHLPTLEEWNAYLRRFGYYVGKKVDDRTWRVREITDDENQ